MKILNVIPYFTPTRGGEVNVCYNLSKCLKERGHDVTIITSDFEFQQEYARSLKDVEILPFKCVFNMSMFLYTPTLCEWLNNNLSNFDVIHLHGFRSYQNNVTCAYAKKFKKPYIIQPHGALPLIVEKKRLKLLYNVIWGNNILRNASKVIALTGTEAELVLKMGVNENKIEIIPNGIDLSRFDDFPIYGHFRTKYLINKDAKIVLYIGRLHKSKGIGLLIKAYAEYSSSFLSDTRLILIGPDYNYRCILEELSKNLGVDDSVSFMGFVSEDDKKAALVDADVFITPSFSGFPITFLESCACGTPIIITDIGDKLDWIHNNVGYVARHDQKSIKEAISLILNNKNLRNELGENGKRIIKHRFDWKILCERFEGSYREVVQNSI